MCQIISPCFLLSRVRPQSVSSNHKLSLPAQRIKRHRQQHKHQRPNQQPPNMPFLHQPSCIETRSYPPDQNACISAFLFATSSLLHTCCGNAAVCYINPRSNAQLRRLSRPPVAVQHPPPPLRPRALLIVAAQLSALISSTYPRNTALAPHLAPP